MELLIPLGVLVVWIILQAWVLPRLGVKTRMSGACGPSSAPTSTENHEHQNVEERRQP